MAKRLFIGFLLLLPFTGRSQLIRFEKDSLPVLLEKAKALNKPVFILFMPPVRTTPPAPSGAVMLEQNSAAAAFFNNNFINYSIAPGNPGFTELADKYFVRVFPTYLYLDNRGNVIYRSAGLSLNPRFYIDDAQKAITRLASGKTISKYEDQYKNGPLTSALLKDYITERKNMGMYDNHMLIDEYIDFQNIKSFDSPEQVLFVLEAGPVVQSRPFMLANLNKGLVETVFSTQSLEKRREINTRIVNNSMKEAIRLKNLNIADNASVFASGTFGRGHRGSREFYTKQISYFKAIKDTVRFLERLDYQMNQQYMNIAADSLLKLKNKRQDSIKVIEARALANGPRDTSDARRFVLSPLPVNEEAIALNNGAYDVYSMGAKARQYLTKAQAWVKRAIESEADYHFYDTLAHIQYQLKLYDEAEKAQVKAIDLAKAEKANTTDLENELRKIQGRTL